MSDTDLSRYTLRGTAGDEKANDDLDLGDELVIVSRVKVAEIKEHLNAEHLLVREHKLEASAAFVVEADPATVKKLGRLTPAQVDQLTGADRLEL